MMAEKEKETAHARQQGPSGPGLGTAEALEYQHSWVGDQEA